MLLSWLDSQMTMRIIGIMHLTSDGYVEADGSQCGRITDLWEV